MLESRVVPRDREQYREHLDTERILALLQHGQAYTCAYSMADDAGDVRAKNVTVSPIDLRLGRVCLSRTDITDSIREQQRLLRVIAYTCELACFIDAFTGEFSMYTRQMVLENLPPHTARDYNAVLDNLVGYFETAMSRETVKQQFHLQTCLLYTSKFHILYLSFHNHISDSIFPRCPGKCFHLLRRVAPGVLFETELPVHQMIFGFRQRIVIEQLPGDVRVDARQKPGDSGDIFLVCRVFRDQGRSDDGLVPLFGCEQQLQIA